MTDTQPTEAAALLEEVDKRRQLIRRRLGNGWFELTVFGIALLAAGVAGLAGKRLGAMQGVVCILAFALAYLVVGARYVQLRRQFGVGFDVFLGMLISAVIFFGCSLASWMLDGVTRSVAIALIPTVGVLVMVAIWRQMWMLWLAVVMLTGGLVDLVPGLNSWASAVVYGVGFVVLAMALIPRVDRSA